ncbi:hypothetical protein [Blastococcus sp. SYSU DS0619]
MSESQPTGYRESPDTTDGPVHETQESEADEGTATLTTDEEAQEDDAVARPGNDAG